mmetsp:Transcript_6014/g.17693  ORF Transcript_6014/g.17693 Transcript_6014/m.17693 type:complete len:223 (+) Transcript_6014:2681-3349(+)
MSKARSSASDLNSSKAAARPHAETKQFNTLTSICNPLASKSKRKLNTRSKASFTYEISFLLFDLKPPLPERLPISRDTASIKAPYVTIVGSILSFFVIVSNCSNAKSILPALLYATIILVCVMTSIVNPFGSCFICSNAFAAASQFPCAEHTAKSLLYIVATSAVDKSSLEASKTKFVNVNACITGEFFNLFDRSHDTKKSTVPYFLILVSFKHGTFASLSR